MRALLVGLCVVAVAACRGPVAPAVEALEANDFLVGDDALRDKPIEAPDRKSTRLNSSHRT